MEESGEIIFKSNYTYSFEVEVTEGIKCVQDMYNNSYAELKLLETITRFLEKLRTTSDRQNNYSIVMNGPPGTGKSYSIKSVCEKLGLTCCELIGNYYFFVMLPLLEYM